MADKKKAEEKTIKSDKKPKSDKSQRSKELSIPVLASTPNYSEASRILGVSQEQIYQWLKDPEFKTQVDEARSELVENAIERLKASMTRAVDVLVALLDDESPVIRRGAANDVLNHTGRFIELKELEQRIKILEERGASE